MNQISSPVLAPIPRLTHTSQSIQNVSPMGRINTPSMQIMYENESAYNPRMMSSMDLRHPVIRRDAAAAATLLSNDELVQ